VNCAQPRLALFTVWLRIAVPADNKAYLRIGGYTFLTFQGDPDFALVLLFSDSERPAAEPGAYDPPCVFRSPVLLGRTPDAVVERLSARAV